MEATRIPTGIPALDEILRGGLVASRSYLIVGETGTGKTVLSLQWLLDGVRRGERCLYITLAEPAGEVARNVAGFGWNLEGLGILDLTPADDPTELAGDEYHVFPPSEVEQTPTWRHIYQELEEKKPDRLVIDSVTQLRYLSSDEYQFRKHILALVAYLNRVGCTSFLVFEPSLLDRETSVALAVDGVIRLRRELSAGRVIDLRSIQIEKLRGSDYLSGLHPMRIASKGIEVFPHRVSQTGDSPPGSLQLASGIAGLDAMLHGGIYSGTTTLISGPAGVGKTTLGMQFLTQAASKGLPAVLFTFEESAASVIARSRAVGMPVDALLQSGKLRVCRLNPMQLYPDELLEWVKKMVEEEHVRAVMVDSLRGYQLAMEQFGNMDAHLFNLVTYLNSRDVFTLLINEVEHITGDVRFTEIGVSYLIDDGLLLRYAEIEAKIVRVIGCLKKRSGAYEPELRPYTITPDGLHVGEPLTGLHGLLTGVPERLE
ncbi:MAG: recombinase RecA [Caldilineae bacterium]|nr:MAG: recombinase RecA [Caldilineae bacterium]